MKCFLCNKSRHYYNEYPQWWQAIIVEGISGEVEEYCDNEVVKYKEAELVGADEGEPVICILQSCYSTLVNTLRHNDMPFFELAAPLIRKFAM